MVRLLVQLTKPEAGNEIYDPTVGSGGFLIQSHQFVDEQGQDTNDLALYGQDSNGTVWSICNMNMILHNITRFTIENGDTLEEPLILKNGQVRKFDRVLANPPFSQNYSRANMKFADRFREWTPENGKKADLMFVQHMLGSLRPRQDGDDHATRRALSRRKEKLIRELLIADDVIEAVISLPGLFYGTGIPACVLVCNKNKPEDLKNTILLSTLTGSMARERIRTSYGLKISRRSILSFRTSESCPNTLDWSANLKLSTSMTTTSTSGAISTMLQMSNPKMSRRTSSAAYRRAR